MEYLVGGFILLLIIGAIGGGKSLGEVIVSGIVGIIILAIIFGVISLYFVKEKENERKKEREKEREKEKMEKILEKEKQEILENLSTEDKYSTDSTYIYFNNYCNKKILLYIHYLTPNGYWKTNGPWSFSPSKSNYLADADGEKIKTKNAILFYEIKGNDINFNGKIKIGDRYMKKIVDEYDDTTIKYSCS